NCLVSWQETITFHIKRSFTNLHDKRGSKVYEIGITNIWEQCVRKTLWIFFKKLLKICFPDKINKMPYGWGGFYPEIIIFKMIDIEKFNMAHNSLRYKLVFVLFKAFI